MKKIFLIVGTLLVSLMTPGIIRADEEFTIDGSKGKLHAWLKYPGQVKSDVKYPLVILCHGFGGQSESPMQEFLADDIVADGMAALRFDFNGHSKSEGEFRDMTVPNEIQDLKNVVAWAQKQPWVSSIALVGHSQGGVVVSMTAGELGESVIKAEVLLAPAAVLRDDALRGNTMGAIYDPWNIQEDIRLPFSPEGNPQYLGKNYIETAIVLPIYETAERYQGPTLIMHGTYDRVVPYTYGERYHHDIKGSELKLVKGDDHMFSNSLKETCQYVADWLQKTLNPAPVDPIQY